MEKARGFCEMDRADFLRGGEKVEKETLKA